MVDAVVCERRGDSEAELIEQARLDPTAFGLLYDRYVQRVYRFVSSRVHESSLAEDITEDVFFSALKAMATYRYTGASFSSWLYRIATNAVCSHYRRCRNELDLETVIDLADTTESVLDAVVRRDRGRRIWHAIERLPSRQRKAMRLRFSADLSTQDVARIMETTPGAVKLLLHRAVQELRRELAPSY
jgi:RNA polymerase sigma-70 factor (ECF subfamily)